MCLILFQCHLSNFKVKWDEQSPILTRIRHFWTLNPVWIHQWLRNDSQSLTSHRRDVLFYVYVIHRISKSYGPKNRWFEFNISKITRLVTAIKSHRFVLLIRYLICSYRSNVVIGHILTYLKKNLFDILVSFQKINLEPLWTCHK